MMAPWLGLGREFGDNRKNTMSDIVQGVGSTICIVCFRRDESVGVKSVRHARPGITNPNNCGVADMLLCFEMVCEEFLHKVLLEFTQKGCLTHA